MTSSIRSQSTQPWRIWTLYILFGLVSVIFITRLIGLQVLEHNTYLEYANNNRTRIVSDAPRRGIIYDRNGFVLARNIASYSIAITPASLPDDPSDIQQIYRELSDITGVPVNSGTVEDAKLVSECVPGPGISQLVELGNSLAPYEPILIQCDVDQNYGDGRQGKISRLAWSKCECRSGP